MAGIIYAEFALQLFTFSPATLKFVSINLALCPIGPSTTLANNPLQNPYALAHDECIKVTVFKIKSPFPNMNVNLE